MVRAAGLVVGWFGRLGWLSRGAARAFAQDDRVVGVWAESRFLACTPTSKERSLGTPPALGMTERKARAKTSKSEGKSKNRSRFLRE